MIIYIVDNCAMHYSRYNKKFLKEIFDILYTSLYSPIINPIDEFFSSFKSLVK